jgi:hypothetical protein
VRARTFAFAAVGFALLAALPSLALAQRGGGGGRGQSGEKDKYAPTTDMAKYPAAAELQKYNPVVLLIDKRKKLALADSQVTALRALQGKIYERNGDLIASYDAIQKAYKPENAGDASSLAADSNHTRALQQVHTMNDILDSLMARRQADDLEAIEMLPTDKQKKDAAKLLDGQDADFAKLMPAGGSASPRRRRP